MNDLTIRSQPSMFIYTDDQPKEVLRINADGTWFYRGKKVESEEEFCEAAKYFYQIMKDQSWKL